MRLAVELYGVEVGVLEGSVSRAFDFVAARAGIAEFGANSSMFGVELPLVARQTRAKAGRRGTKAVDDGQIRALLENSLSASLGNLAEVGKSSLAGVQPKIVLAAQIDLSRRRSTRFWLPLRPSSHSRARTRSWPRRSGLLRSGCCRAEPPDSPYRCESARRSRTLRLAVRRAPPAIDAKQVQLSAD